MKLKDIIGSMASKFAALALALTCAGNVWAADPVAKIGTTEYTMLADAVAAAQDGETVTLLADAAQNDGIIFDKAGAGVILDLDGKTFTVNTGANCNNRAFRIDNGTLTVKNGSIVAAGSGTTSSNGAGCYGAFRVEKGGTLNIQDATLSNSRPWGLNVKICGGRANLERVTINSSYGGGIEVTEADLGALSQPGYAELTDCTFTQTGYFDHCSTALSVSGGSELVVNSGTYTSENYGLYVFSSGGKITVKGGTITGENKAAVKAAMDTNTYPAYTGAVQISGGRFKGTLDVTSPASMSISGGVFTIAPGTAYLAPGYVVITNTDAATKDAYPYTVAGAVAQIGETKYATLAEAIAAVPTTGAETTITMIANSAEPAVITVASGKSVVLDLNGKTVSYTTDAKSVNFLTNKGTLTIQDNSENADGQVLLTAQPDTGYSVENVTIYNCGGTLTLVSGTVKNATGGGLAYAVNNSSNAWGSDVVSTFNMQGGTVSAPSGDAALRVYQNCSASSTVLSKNYVNITGGTILDTGIFVDTTLYTANGSTEGFADSIDTQINISGGTVNGLIDMKIRHPYNTRLNITGGDFANCKMWVRKYASEYKGDEPTESMVYISGGKFAFVAGKAFGLSYDCGATSWTTYEKPYAVSGGVFNVEVPENACVAGKTSIANTETETKDAYPYTVGVAVAQIGTKGYATLPDAIAAAQNGDTVKLLADVDMRSSFASASARFPISKSLTIDGQNHSITVGGRGFGVGMNASSKIDVTFKDVMIANSSAGARCIDTRGNLNSLTLDHATLNTNDATSGYTQPLTIGGSQSDKATVSIVNGSKIQTNDEGTAYYAIITFNPVNMTIDDSTIKGWACIYAKGPDGSAGSAGSVFTITDSELVSKNEYSGTSNAFAMLMAEDDNVTFNVTNTKIDVNATGDQHQAIVATGSSSQATGVAANLGEGNEVTLSGEATFELNSGSAVVSGGTFNVAVPEEVCADGYIPAAQDPDTGKYTVKTGSYVAQNTTTVVKYETLAAAIADAQAGDTVKLLADIDLGSGYVALDKALTLAGDYTITSTAAQAVLLTGSGDVTIGCDIVATNGHGIQAGSDEAAYSGKLTVDGATLTVAKRGIRVYAEDTGFGIAVNNSTIQSNVDDPTAVYTTGNDAIALSLGTTDGKGYTVTITDSVLQGFSYCINAVMSGSNLTVTMNGGATYGRAALNVWGSNNTLTLDGVEVHGLNNQTGPTEGFACIVENTGAKNNTYNINGCTFVSTLSSAAASASGSSATEQMIDLRGSNATVKITGETTYTAKIGDETIAPTDEAYGRFGLIYSANSVSVPSGNSIDLDSSASASLADVLTVLPKDVETDDSKVFTDGTSLGYVPEVHYYWATASGFEGGYYDFNDPFDNGWLADGEYVALQKNVALTKDLSTDKSFNLLLGEYTLSPGEYSITLADGATVTSDKSGLGDLFSAPSQNHEIRETAAGDGKFAYTFVIPEYQVTFIQIEDADVEVSAMPENFSFAKGSGEIALQKPTYTSSSKTFAGWKVKDSDPEVILSAIPAGATTDYELVATWTGVKTVTVDAGESKTPTIKVTDDWIEKNVTVDEGATPAEVTAAVEEALNKEEANGNKAWENYVLGVAPTAAVTADVKQGEVSATPVTSNVKVPAYDTGFKVQYRLDKVDASGGNATVAVAKQDSDVLPLDLSKMTEAVAYYKTTAVITANNDADVSVEVKSENTVGVMKVTNAPKTAIVGVPWEALDSTGAIAVADLVRTATLSEGDELYAYDSEAKKYKSWTLENGEWKSMTTATESGSEEADKASTVKLDRGKAVWLKRSDASKPLYLVGEVATGDASTTLEAGTETEPSWNLVASPLAEKVSIADVIGESTTDKIIVPTAGAPKNIRRGSDGKYYYDTTVPVMDGDVQVGVAAVTKEVTELDAGTGFWFLNSGNKEKIEWSSSAD